VHFDYKPPRAEAADGVWASASACMRNYLVLRERVRAFRADPEVSAALEAAEVATLREPTLAPGETLADLRRATYDVEGLAERSVGMEALDQLAMDHLLGIR
jgi:xylose isomerase